MGTPEDVLEPSPETALPAGCLSGWMEKEMHAGEEADLFSTANSQRAERGWAV